MVCSLNVGAQFAERSVNINFDELKSSILVAPMQRTLDINSSPSKINLPLPDGSKEDFHVLESPIMSKEFSREFPQIKTYKVINKKGDIRGRITLGKEVFYGILFSSNGMITINPIQPENNGNKYRVTLGENPEQDNIGTHICNAADHNQQKASAPKRSASAPTFSNGSDLRKYKLAIVCTGEFYQANGANSASVNTVITNSVNGIQAFFEKELAVEFILQTPFLYTNPSTDPFVPGPSRVIMAADAIHLNFAVGDYDLGHVFHDSDQAPDELFGGGVAGLGVLCKNIFPSNANGYWKGRGWSGADDNTLASWYRLAAHEFGHMFGATHTFNGNQLNCNAPNHPENNAYEIGSGTTMMSYRNLCGAGQNVPSNGTGDDYFHNNSLQLMIDTMISVSCSSISSTGNTPPIANAGSNYTIPKSTPFELTGSATDADGDALTFTWEQYNEDDEVYGPNSVATHGKIGAAAASDSGAPLFKSSPPSSSPSRVFPTWSLIAVGNNNAQDFEALPTVARNMNFKLTVRDNNILGGGLSDDDMSIVVNGNTGPFELTSQNSTTTWIANGTNTATISWNVNGTNAAPINASNVDIFFSVDGGETFPFTLATAVTNDGSHVINIPFYPTSIGRVKVKATNNIFFDVNNANIEISSPTCSAFGSTFSPAANVSANEGSSDLNLSLTPNYGLVLNSVTGTLSANDPASTLAVEDATGGCLNFNGNVTVYDQYEFQVDASGTYTFTRTALGPMLSLYEISFNGGAVCTNFLGSNGIFNGVNVSVDNDVSASLNAGQTYFLVVSSFGATSPTLPHAYTVNASGPGTVYDGPVPPGAGYDYTFVAVDQNTSSIHGYDSNGNFSNVSNFPAGDYKVYGLSYASGASLPIVGTSMTTLQSNLANLNPCANLSTNCISLEIIGSCPPNFISANALSGTVNSIEDYETNGDIESTQILQSNAKVDYDSANGIELKPGFEVKLGAEFCALIDGCNAGMGGINLKEDKDRRKKDKKDKSLKRKRLKK